MIRVKDYVYRAYVRRAVDADTLDLLVIVADFGFYQWIVKPVRVRLRDVDAVELFRGPEREKGREAQKLVWRLLVDEEKCELRQFTLRTHMDKTGARGRYLGLIYVPIGPTGWEGRRGRGYVDERNLDHDWLSNSRVIDPVTGSWSVRLSVWIEKEEFDKG